MSFTVHEADMRAENIEKVVKGFALQEYRFKELVMIQSSSAWQETYFQEDSTELTGGTGSAVKGVPRLANFPYAEANWTEKSSFLVKHGLEGVISYEDARTNNISVIARTLLRIARAVTASVDSEIYNVLTEIDGTASPVLINKVAITAGNEWDSDTVANRDPIQDILNAKKEIAIDNYDPDRNGYLLLNPKDYANLLGNANVRNAGQFYTDAVTSNGRVGKIVGLNIIVSNNVSNDKAVVVVAKECATWKQNAPLTVKTIEEPGIKWTIRAWEIGVTQLINPECVCLISNTQK